MAQQAQIFVFKQGSLEKSRWSTRVLTLDTPTCTATVSRSGRAKDLYHHSLQVLCVNTFPDVDLTHTKLHRNSVEAKWVLRLVGRKVPVPDFTAERAPTTEIREASETPAATPSAVCSATSTGTSVDKPAATFAVAKTRMKNKAGDAWLMRCTSQDTYDLAIKLLRRMTRSEDATPQGAAYLAAEGVSE